MKVVNLSPSGSVHDPLPLTCKGAVPLFGDTENVQVGGEFFFALSKDLTCWLADGLAPLLACPVNTTVKSPAAVYVCWVWIELPSAFTGADPSPQFSETLVIFGASWPPPPLQEPEAVAVQGMVPLCGVTLRLHWGVPGSDMPGIEPSVSRRTTNATCLPRSAKRLHCMGPPDQYFARGFALWAGQGSCEIHLDTAKLSRSSLAPGHARIAH
jgi:hypothetical protein